ncbi:MAG TPA: restriction endonuclease subunit M [Bacteroidales bacterium]|nr:restriction endonuclease subunit M [Bacteroidales bacterium]
MAEQQVPTVQPSPARQVKSRERVQQHGEVFTSEREVNAMLDLVKHETERIDSRFLEPACGDGNFLAEILRRKLSVCRRFVEQKKNTRLEYEKNAVLAVSSIYGIELLRDNAETCRERLFRIFETEYRSLFGEAVNPDCLRSIRYLLSKNIIQGNALTYHRVDDPDKWIVISEWSLLGSGMMNRRDYEFSYMVGKTVGTDLFSDTPCQTFPPAHFLQLNPQSYHE